MNGYRAHKSLERTEMSRCCRACFAAKACCASRSSARSCSTSLCRPRRSDSYWSVFCAVFMLLLITSSRSLQKSFAGSRFLANVFSARLSCARFSSWESLGVKQSHASSQLLHPAATMRNHVIGAYESSSRVGKTAGIVGTCERCSLCIGAGGGWCGGVCGGFTLGDAYRDAELRKLDDDDEAADDALPAGETGGGWLIWALDAARRSSFTISETMRPRSE